MIPKTVKIYRGKLPEAPGVYLFKDVKGGILYIGKAGSLRRRVESYFLRPHETRIQKLVSAIRWIEYRQTETAIEALIVEAELIRKHQPPFNVREKDDKSFLYVAITKEPFPRVLLVRRSELGKGIHYGPFTSASSIREALRILRRIFPWSVHERPANSDRRHERIPCFEYEIGLCPGTCIGAISRAEYGKNIKNLKLFFEGKKKRILAALERAMKAASKKLEFERAEKMRRQIFAFQHIQDIALIKDSELDSLKIGELAGGKTHRIEGYDISNISGTSAVGAMVVFMGDEPAKSEYRKFRIRTVTGSNDVGMLEEVLRRRFHNQWPLPHLILIDGGIGQVNRARRVLVEFGLKIPVVGIAKGLERKRNDFYGGIPRWTLPAVLIRVRNEAHRFAIRYHRKLRENVAGRT